MENFMTLTGCSTEFAAVKFLFQSNGGNQDPSMSSAIYLFSAYPNYAPYQFALGRITKLSLFVIKGGE